MKIDLDNKINYLLNNYDRRYILQGICYIDNYFVVTSYSKDKSKNSIITIYDNDFNFYNKIELDNNAHVGGIAYDNKHNIVWITSKNGCISGYDKNKLLNQETDKLFAIKELKNIKVGTDLINYKGIPSVAYITYYKEKLYLGNFTLIKKAKLLSYDINNDGSINLESKNIISNNFLNKVQGIIFYKKNIILSRSYGKMNKSTLTILDKDFKRINDYKIDLNMSEQLAIVDNKLYILSEIGSNFYRGNNGIDLISLDIK